MLHASKQLKYMILYHPRWVLDTLESEKKMFSINIMFTDPTSNF